MIKEERRQWPREASPSSEIGILRPQNDAEGQEGASEDRRDTWLVHIRNRSEGGLLLEAPLSFGIGSLLDMQMRLVHEDGWQAIKGEVVWERETPDSNKYCFLGIRLHPETREILPQNMDLTGKSGMCPSDLEFLRGTQLFDAISEETKCPLLNRMTSEYVEPGKRFITQGEPGDAVYVIQEGSCVVSVEKDGSEHPLSRLRAGDIAGEIALITDWPRSAHIDAETKVKLWGLTKAQFDEVCEECGDIRNFLTELVARRLSRESVTADRTVGKYIINEIIGLGGWGIVYRGIHKDLNMPVAIKMLKHDMAMDPDFSKKFRYEAKTIAHLNHENIIRVYDFEELYRTIFIIMEYLRGLPLDYVLEKMEKLPASRVVDILLQVCAGLDYAHKQGIIHQDIKPPNIFIQPNDQVKIVDFGLACTPGETDSSLRGTIFYAPPELIEGDSVNEQTDVYCLGITAFEMITGQRPFPEDDINKMLNMRLREDIPDPRTFVPDLPEELCDFVVRSTHRDLNTRYKSISEAMDDLRPMVKKLGVKREPRLEEQRKMMSLFLFYPNKQESLLKRLVEGFDSELNKLGAELRTTEFRDVSLEHKKG
jgi:serine/threonine protein kinase